MTQRSALALAAVLAIVGAARAAAQESVILRLDPTVGQVSRYRLQSRMWMREGSAFGSDTSAPTMTATMYSTQTVAAADSGTRAIVTVIDSSKMDLPPGMGPGPGTDMYKGMTTTRRVDAAGRVLSTHVVPGPNMPPAFAQRASGQPYGPRSWPERAMKVGDEWTDSTAATSGGTTAREVFSYRMERIEHRGASVVATLSVRGAGGTQPDSAHATTVGGGYTGEVVVDVTRRLTLRMTNENRTTIQAQDGTRTIRGLVVIELLEP